ncbi:MAG: BatD family protein [Pirellulales bacterium]|nr:BatD family protein [Pirellulales bacterium]
MGRTRGASLVSPGRCPGLGEPRPFGAWKSVLIIIASLLITCSSGGAASAAGDQPELLVEVDRTEIYEGESVLYRVTLNHVEHPSPPKLEGFDRDFTVTSLGEQSLDFQNVMIINGRRTETIRRGRQYNYQLTPKRTGELTIPAPTAEVDGVTLRGRAVRISVEPASRQDVVRMEITVAPQAVYPLQPFQVTLSIAVKALPGPEADKNPLGVQSAPPQLIIPWANDRRLPEGLEPETDLDRWLGRLVDRRGTGFAVNNFRQRDVFSFFEDRPLTFMPRPEKIELSDKDGKQAVYWRYQFKRTFTATKVDVYTFGPATLKGVFGVAGDAEDRLVGKEIYAVAKALHVAIKDVPTEGRPESYCGAIGRFDLSAELTPRKAKTGDPMTLTLTLSGQGTLEDAVAPDLAKIPGIAGKFKVYDATEQTRDGRRQFTYSLRPLDADVTEFPAIPVAYFDVQQDRFVTQRTPPMPIEISRAAVLAGRDIVAAPGAAAGRSQEVEMQKGGIYANILDPNLAVDQGVDPQPWLIGLGGVTGFYALLAFGAVAWRRRSGDTVRLRRRSAPAAAHKRLHAGLDALQAGQKREGIEQIEAAVKNLVADWIDAPAAGMTAAEAARHLETLGVNGEVIAAARRLLDNCESVRYGATAADLAALHRDARPTVQSLLKALRRAK